MKKTLCLALNLLVAVSLAGCGGEAKDPETFTPSAPRRVE